MVLNGANVKIGAALDEWVWAAPDSWGALYHALGTIHQGAHVAAFTFRSTPWTQGRSCNVVDGRRAKSDPNRAAHQPLQVLRLPFWLISAPLRGLLLLLRGRGRRSDYDQCICSTLAERRRRRLQHPLALVLRADVIVARFGGLTGDIDTLFRAPFTVLRRCPSARLFRRSPHGLQRAPSRSASRRWCVCHRAAVTLKTEGPGAPDPHVI